MKDNRTSVKRSLLVSAIALTTAKPVMVKKSADARLAPSPAQSTLPQLPFNVYHKQTNSLV